MHAQSLLYLFFALPSCSHPAGLPPHLQSSQITFAVFKDSLIYRSSHSAHPLHVHPISTLPPLVTTGCPPRVAPPSSSLPSPPDPEPRLHRLRIDRPRGAFIYSRYLYINLCPSIRLPPPPCPRPPPPPRQIPPLPARSTARA